MQIKRLLDDREVFAGDRVFDAQGASMLRKPLMNEGVLFLRIEAGFFYLSPREACNRKSIGMFFGMYCRDGVVRH